MRDIKQLFNNFIALLSSKMISMLLGIVVTVVIIRFLGNERYGILSLYLSVVYLILYLFINWNNSAIVRFGREELLQQSKINKIFSTQLIILAFVYATIVPLLFIFRYKLRQYIGIDELYISTIILLSICISLTNTFEYLFQAYGYLKQMAVMKILDRVLMIVFLIIIFGIFKKVNITYIILIYILSYFFQIIYGIYVIGLKNCLPFVFDKQTIQTMFRYSWPLIFAFSSGYIIDWVDLFFIRYFLSIEHVGLYQCAYQGMLSLSSIIMMVSVILFPIFVTFKVHKEIEKVRYLYQRILIQLIIPLCFILIIFSNVSQYVFYMLFGKEFLVSGYIFNILLISLSFLGISVFYSPLLSAFDLIKQMSLCNIVFGIVNIILDLLLIPLLGMYGAALATGISYGVGSLGYMFFGNRILAIKNSSILWFPLSLTIIVSINVVFKNITLNIIMLVIYIVFAVVTIRKCDYLNEEDRRMLDHISMPAVFKRAITVMAQTVKYKV